MALEGDKLAKYNAQFQRSVASPLQETAAPKAPALDGAVVLDKYIGQDMTVARSMTGAEFYSMVGHIKRQEGPRGEALEQELMKITRQADKKIRLVDWVTQNIGGGVTAPSPAVVKPAVNAMENMPPAGTPSKSVSVAANMAPDLGISRLDLSSAMGTERNVGGGAETARGRPNTARPQLGGSAMAGLLGSSPKGEAPPLTARPSTADAAPTGGAVQDMSVVMAAFVGGRDHLKMSGSEYYSLVAWLKSKGHESIEDTLLKVKALGDKKFHLVRHMKEHCADLHPAASAPLPATHQPPVDISEPPLTQRQPPVAPPPQMVGQAQVMHLPQQPAAPVMPPADFAAAAGNQAAAIAAAVATIQQAAGGGASPAVVDGVRALEGTLGRLEESLNFAVECMQTDLAHAKDQLATLKSQVGLA